MLYAYGVNTVHSNRAISLIKFIKIEDKVSHEHIY